MSRKTRIESVFLNIPYDVGFEKLYLAYVVGMTQLGLAINAALAGSKSLFAPAIFQDLTLAALVESQKLIGKRKTKAAAGRRGRRVTS